MTSRRPKTPCAESLRDVRGTGQTQRKAEIVGSIQAISVQDVRSGARMFSENSQIWARLLDALPVPPNDHESNKVADEEDEQAGQACRMGYSWMW